MTEQERKEFEAWAVTIGVDDFSKGDLYGYSNVLTANCYATWLAARRTQNAKVRELVEAVERCKQEVDEYTSFYMRSRVNEAHALATQLKEQGEDLSCPGCGGPTEIDREEPPNPYYCEECKG